MEREVLSVLSIAFLECVSGGVVVRAEGGVN